MRLSQRSTHWPTHWEGHYHIPHGLSNSLVLPAVLEFNMPEASGLYAELAEVVIGEPVAGSDEAKTAALVGATPAY